MTIGRRAILAGAPTLFSAMSVPLGQAARPPRLLALVVGIDTYPNINKLHGCVNDAKAISEAVGPFAARMVTMFNAEATREKFLATWDGYIQESQAGDQILIAYSGHGGREPEHTKGSRPDGFERTLIFHDFDQTLRPKNGQRVFDVELGARLANASRRQIVTWLVADSCYSGGLTRSVDPRANAVSVRAYHYEVVDDMLADLPMPSTEPTAQSNIVFLAGAQPDQPVQEQTLGGQPHGALSYAFANGVRRTADTGNATVRDFVLKIVAETRQIAEGRQMPFNIIRTDQNAAAFCATGTAMGVPPQPSPETPILRIFTLQAMSASAASSQAVTTMINTVRAMSGVRIVSSRDGADLILDASKGELVSANGDLLASDLTPGVNADADIKGAISKVAVLGSLASFPSANLEMGLLLPGAELAAGGVNSQNQLHRIGERLDVVVRPLLGGELIVLSVDAWGTIVVLQPRDGQRTQLKKAEWRLTVEVIAPRGAGHVIAIFSTKPLGPLLEYIKTVEGRPGGLEAAAPRMIAAAAARDVDLGILGFFS